MMKEKHNEALLVRHSIILCIWWKQVVRKLSCLTIREGTLAVRGPRPCCCMNRAGDKFCLQHVLRVPCRDQAVVSFLCCWWWARFQAPLVADLCSNWWGNVVDFKGIPDLTWEDCLGPLSYAMGSDCFMKTELESLSIQERHSSTLVYLGRLTSLTCSVRWRLFLVPS